jgi:hypothetical protein
VAEPVVLIADLFPGVVLDTATGERVEGIPRGAKLHVIVSTTQIAIGWDAGTVNGERKIGSLMLDISEMDTDDLNHQGGIVGPYDVKRAGGCSCGQDLHLRAAAGLQAPLIRLRLTRRVNRPLLCWHGWWGAPTAS